MSTEKQQQTSGGFVYTRQDTPQMAEPASANILFTNQKTTQQTNHFGWGKDVADAATQTSTLMKFQTYAERIVTFKTRPKAMAINSVELAHAGFIYTGFSDRVFCPWCKLTLHEFETSDSPYKEHVKHSRGCGYLKMTLPDSIMALSKSLRSKGFYPL